MNTIELDTDPHWFDAQAERHEEVPRAASVPTGVLRLLCLRGARVHVQHGLSWDPHLYALIN